MAKFNGLTEEEVDELLEIKKLMDSSLQQAFTETAEINLQLRIDLGKIEAQVQELKDTIAYYENEMKVTRRP